MTRRLASCAAIATVVLLVTGCGTSGADGGSGTPPAQWAAGFCSALTTWTGSMKAFAGTLDENGLTAESLRRAANDAKDATTRFADDTRALGTPDTDSGGDVRDSLDALTAGVQDDVTAIEQTAGDVSGVGEVVRALPVIGATLSTMGKRVQTMLGELERADAGGALRDAFTRTRACDDLTK